MSADTEYAIRMAHYFNKNSKSGMFVYLMQDLSQIKEGHISEIHTIILDLERDDETEHLLKELLPPGCRRIYLTDLMTGISRISESEWSASKYLSCRDILDIVEIERKQSGHQAAKVGRSSTVLGIYSPVNRCGKTSMAVCAAKLLGEKAVMVTMDPYGSFFEEEEDNLCEFIYEISKYDISERYRILDLNDENLLEGSGGLIERYVKQKAGIRYIPVRREDIYEITSAQVELLLKVLKENFSYIILDFSHMNCNPARIVDKCDIVFIPVLNDLLSVDKYESFLKEFENPASKGAMKKVLLPPVIRAERVEQFYEELNWSSFGKKVEEILREAGILSLTEEGGDTDE